MSGVLEITTRIGCKINCQYCPQKLLIENYCQQQRPLEMTFETFKNCIDKVPQDVMIDFAGMSEPWLNSECTKMVQYAAQCGHKISIFSTLVGMQKKDLEVLKKIELEQFVIHIPDKEKHSHIEITEEYIELLKEAQKLENVSMMHYSCHGTVDEKISSILDKTLIIADEMIDRAGNLKNNELPHVTCNGEKTCALTGNHLNSNILLPDGSVLLCCMDYGMKHVLGNLLKETYAEIQQNTEIIRVREGLKTGNEDVLCTKCSNAINFEELTDMYVKKNIENIELWKAQKWLKEQVVFHKVQENDQKRYIDDLLQGKDWLEQHTQEQENYIAELLQGKDWLEQHGQKQEKYIEDLIQENNWLKTKSDELTQEKNQMELKVSSMEEQLTLLENDISKLRYKLNLLKEDKLIQKIIKMKKYSI